LARFFHERLTNGLLNKMASVIDRQLGQCPIDHVVLGGGCSANSWLRAGFANWCMRRNYRLSIPESLDYCIDNAVMIAHTAILYLQDEEAHAGGGAGTPSAYLGQGILLEHEATVGEDAAKPPPAARFDRQGDRSSAILASDYIGRAARAIRSGQLVIFPTETVYGIGANIYDDNAVKSIFVAKGRPSDNPLIVHVSSIDMLETLVTEITEHHKALIRAFWPGPLTIIFKAKASGIAAGVSCGLDTLAVRMPDNPIALELISAAGVPIAAPSANLSGYPSATCTEHALNDFDGKVAYILEGGTSRYGFESTIVLVNESAVTVLRQGPIGANELAQTTGLPIDAVRGQLAHDAKPLAPGMKYRHYAPDKPVYMISGDSSYLCGITAALKADEKKVGLILDEAVPAPAAAAKIFYYRQLGESLYAGLRRLDRDDIDVILVKTPPHGSLYWEAIMEKLRKMALREFRQA
jgi:L-threonylcarbamoyladenylate synthase